MFDGFDIALIFRNELLVKLNQAHRLGFVAGDAFLPSTIMRSRSLSPVKNAFYSAAEWAANFVSLFVLLLTPRAARDPIPKTAFLYVDKRLKRFCTDENTPMLQLGLLKYLLCFGRGHLYSVLSRREILNSLIRAIRVRRFIASQIYIEGSIKGLNIERACSLSGFGVLRCFDLIVASSAIAQLDHVESAGHFDVYTALMSQLRQQGKIKSFQGVQHGLYEYFIFGKPAPLFYDKYQLLFAESQPYFRRYLCANVDCAFVVRERKAAFARCNRPSATIGIALQNDDEASDMRLLQHIQEIAGRYALLAYVHPATGAKSLLKLRSRFPNIEFEPKTRCADIDVIITRYSTLAMDYVAIGVNAIFWAAPDRVCVSFSGNPKIHQVEELGEMGRVLASVLASREMISL